MCYVAVCACIRSAVTKLKVSHKMIYSKVKADPDRAKTPHSNTPPHVYITMWKYLHNAAQMFTQRKKAWFHNRSSVDAAKETLCVSIPTLLLQSGTFESATVSTFY